MKNFALVSFFILAAANLFAQDKVTAQKLRTFDAFAAKVMADWKVQGMAIAVVQKDKVVLARGYGYRDVEKKLPATADTQFAIGSCTKAFTAAAICMTAEDEKIDLDKPVRDFLPTFKLQDEYVTNNMTPRDLLCHRSGLPRHDLVWYGSDFSRKEIFDRLQYLESNKPFRTTWQYQNLMFMTAGYLVGEMNHTSWEAYVKEKLLTPLQMRDTNFSVKDMSQAKEGSLGYIERKDKVQVIPYRNIDAMGPAGSINSTANDMAHWLMALINGGKYNGEQVLSEKTVREVQTPTMVMPAQVPLQYDESFYSSYGLAWTITAYRGHVRVDHGGNIDGFSASTCFLPKDSVGIVVLTNMNGTAATSIIRNNLIDRMLGMNEVDWNKRLLDEVKKTKEAATKVKKEEDAGQVKGTRPSHELTAYTGTFSHPAYGDVAIAPDGDSLDVTFHNMKMKLRHYHYDVFEIRDDETFEGAKISFGANLKGEVDKLWIQMDANVKDIEFARKVEIRVLAKSELEKYVGQYDFGGVEAKIYIKGDSTLMMLVPGQPDYELQAIRENEFQLKGLTGFIVKFTVEGNKVTELASIQPNGTFKAKKK